ncbi:VWA domain-containing protein [bacterium]|nr:VWA domain-containing protein [bacterium]
MKRRRLLIVVGFLLIGGGIIIFSSLGNSPQITQTARSNHADLMPDWPTIALWPFGSDDAASDIDANDELNTISAVDPWQVTTIIVLDDSGSMNEQIKEAKAAIVQAVSQFSPESRVGVIALNAGLVSDVVTAAEAADRLPEQLRSIFADGGTPLGSRLNDAAEILAAEAEQRRGFGVFRILVTTDGEASDADRLHEAVSEILSKTPIELATIGIGIGEGHALNVPGFTSYVSVNGVDGLAGALTAAAAEQTTFQPIDRFEE